jgi:transcriptional regulator with XRE-family HTH domain
MMEDSSIMVDAAATDLNQRIARRVRALRTARGLSLEALAAASGVSRSMISLIERGESSPTAVVLEKLGAGLGVTLASLFDDPAAAAEPVRRRRDQPVWQDPASGYRRRNVSPAGVDSPIRIVEVEFPAGARVAYESPGSRPVVHQQVWVLDGRIDVAWGRTVHRLDPGDCLAMRLDAPVVFHNPTRKAAHYVVVLADGWR